MRTDLRMESSAQVASGSGTSEQSKLHFCAEHTHVSRGAGGARNMRQGQASSQLPTGPEPSIGRLDGPMVLTGPATGRRLAVGPIYACGNRGTGWMVHANVCMQSGTGTSSPDIRHSRGLLGWVGGRGIVRCPPRVETRKPGHIVIEAEADAHHTLRIRATSTVAIDHDVSPNHQLHPRHPRERSAMTRTG